MSKRPLVSGPFIDASLLAFVDEQRAANEMIRIQAANVGLPGSTNPAKLRRNRLYNRDGSLRPTLASEASDRLLATAFGDVLVRIFEVAGPHAKIVHFHGGGWTFGSVYEQDGLLSALAKRTGATVYSIDYPLAPENQLPYIIEVATAALHAIVTASPGQRVGIVGESAGAHVALCSVIGMAAPLRQRIHAMSLAYGIYDLSMTPSQRVWGDEFLGLSTPWLEYFYSLAIPGRSRDERSHPGLSPLYADLTSLPPAIFSVGELDPLLDDSLFIFQRWLAAGNEGALCVYPASPHGFNHAKTRMAEACNATIGDFLAANFERSSARR